MNNFEIRFFQCKDTGKWRFRITYADCRGVEQSRFLDREELLREFSYPNMLMDVDVLGALTEIAKYVNNHLVHDMTGVVTQTSNAMYCHHCGKEKTL